MEGSDRLATSSLILQHGTPTKSINLDLLSSCLHLNHGGHHQIKLMIVSFIDVAPFIKYHAVQRDLHKAKGNKTHKIQRDKKRNQT